MIAASGGVVNFIAILIPMLMALYYGFRCLFQTEAAIAEWGIGAASESIVKICRCYALTQGGCMRSSYSPLQQVLGNCLLSLRSGQRCSCTLATPLRIALGQR